MCGRLCVPSPILCAPRSNALPDTDDKQIRVPLKQFLHHEYCHDPDTVIIEELGLRHGFCRVDLAVVNGSLRGFEIKSDRDTFKRLGRQAETYNRVLDFITVVVGERHTNEILGVSPQWWGIQLAKCEPVDGIKFIQVREASQNPSPDKLAIAKLLWRQEALALLEKLGAAEGLRSKPRAFIYPRLAEVAGVNALRSYVRDRLRSRNDWRSGERQMSYDG